MTPRLGLLPERLTNPAAATRAAGIALAALGLEWMRVLVARQPDLALVSLVAGGAALGALGISVGARDVGLSRSGLGFKLAAGIAVGLILLLPALTRGRSGPLLPAPYAAAAIVVSIGEEVAFRGALFAAMDAWLGPVPAIIGSTLVYTAGHVLSHPPEFLVPVAAAGALLAVWRWACRDLVAPIVAHGIADLAL